MKENPVRATPEQLERVATFSTCEVGNTPAAVPPRYLARLRTTTR